MMRATAIAIAALGGLVLGYLVGLPRPGGSMEPRAGPSPSMPTAALDDLEAIKRSVRALEDAIVAKPPEKSAASPGPDTEDRGRAIEALAVSADPEAAAEVLEIYACKREIRWWKRELEGDINWLRSRHEATQKVFFLDDSNQLAEALRDLNAIGSIAEFDCWLIDRRDTFERIIVRDKYLWKEWKSRERE